MILTSGKTSKATVLKSLVNNKSKRQKREKQKVYLTLIPPVGTEAHTHTHIVGISYYNSTVTMERGIISVICWVWRLSREEIPFLAAGCFM